MAEAVPSQRSFSKHLKSLTAAQMRETVSGAVRTISEDEQASNQTKVELAEPLDYEKELFNSKDRIKQVKDEKIISLLLFPTNDITVMSEDRTLRTEKSTVPPGAAMQAELFFTKQCLALYSSKWERLRYNYSKYSTGVESWEKNLDHKSLPMLQFEINEIEEEERRRAQDIAAAKEKIQYKRGFLTKGPFPGEGTFAQKWKRRWCVLQPGSTDGNYYLEIYRDDKTQSFIKRLNLGTCEDIRKNPKSRQFGFDLLTGDEKTVYPLAAETEEELKDWMDAFSKILGVDEIPSQTVDINTWNRSDTLRDPQRTALLPELLVYTTGTNKHNDAARKLGRQSVFSVYPGLIGQKTGVDNQRGETPYPEEPVGQLRFIVRCNSLVFRLLASNNSRELGHIEPFFISLALYDAAKGLKITEDFHVDLNDFHLREMLDQHKAKTLSANNKSLKIGASELKSEEQWPTMSNQCLFSVTFPSQDIYLVIRVEKIVQQGISACAEPYIKGGEDTKVAQKLQKQVPSLCNFLGQYRMPFAWAARPLFDGNGHLDNSAEFTPLFRQDKDRLTNTDLLKMLSDFKNIHKLKLASIPGSIDVSVISYSEPRTGVLNPSLVPVRPFSSGTASLDTIIREVQEFPPLEEYHPHPHYHISLTYTHYLYLYPLSLKYDSQRNFTKARNITCCVEVKANDKLNSDPLPVIYGKAVGPVFKDKAFTPILHHCTTPSYYEEIKIELPVNISQKHHILFTFYHIACELQKASKKETVSAIVGFSWLPLLSEGRLVSEVQQLPVSSQLRDGYLGLQQKPVPELKYVDGQKALFRVDVKPMSSIYPKEKVLHVFFEICNQISKREFPSDQVVMDAISDMYGIRLSSLVNHLPVILDQLFNLLLFLERDHEVVKVQVIKLLIHILDVMEKAQRTAEVKSYVEFIFKTKINNINQRTLHDELAKQMALYLKQQDSNDILKLLEHMWFFFDTMLKSVAQYLRLEGKLDKLSSRKKCPYSEDLYWNLQTVVCNIQTCSRMSSEDGKRANKSMACFIRACFTVLDRGQVFQLMAKYMQTFKVRDNKFMFDLKFDFLQIICDYEHFIPLNFPWPEIITGGPIATEVNDEFCQKHFPLGILLREVASAIRYEPLTSRKRALRVLRNVIAKQDLDDRLKQNSQKGIIAQLFFPLITIAFENVHRLDSGITSTLQPQQSREADPSGVLTPQPGGKRTSVISSFSMMSHAPSGNTPEKEAKDGRASPLGTASQSTSMVTLMGPSNRASKRPPLFSISELGAPPAKEAPAGESLVLSSFGGNEPINQKMAAVDAALQEWDRLSPEETKDLLASVIFVLKNIDQEHLLSWCRQSMGSLSGIPTSIWDRYIYPQLLQFFDLLGQCLQVFNFKGIFAVTSELQASVTVQKQMTKQSSESSVEKKAAVQGAAKKGTQKRTISVVPEITPVMFHSAQDEVDGEEVLTDEKRQNLVKATEHCAMEVSLVVLDILEMFSANFEHELMADDGDNILMSKYFQLLMTFLQTNQPVEMLQHVFASVRSFVHRFPSTLFKGGTEYTSLLCYEVLKCCNSRLPLVRSEAATLLYLILKKNWEIFHGAGLDRTYVQSTIAISVLVSQIREKSDNHLRRSLFVLSNVPVQENMIKAREFTREVNELMKRLRTVLSSSAQMKEYHNDPEKLADLYYDLAQSYASSPELRKTWLNNLLELHASRGNYSEAAMCCLHMAGLIAEYLKLKGEYPMGCEGFETISVNISKEESGIKRDVETGDTEQCYTKLDLALELQRALEFLWKAERYELMVDVGKLLLPFYEEWRDYESMSAMFKQLQHATEKVVEVTKTRKRYLGTFFKVAFFGKPFRVDDGAEYLYKEPKVTSLAEFSMRLKTMYGKRFGADVVNIIQSSNKVNPEKDKLDLEKAHIQIIHVEPYHNEEELIERKTDFERHNHISSFVFETPFTKGGKAHGDTVNQYKRKTIITTGNWFPYVKKRIRIIHENSTELSPINVGIEAIEKKTKELSEEVNRSVPDVKKLQLVLQGSVSAQVNIGAQEYANAFLKDTEVGKYPEKEVEKLRDAYRDFLLVCQEALELNHRLITAEQQEYQADMEEKFRVMQDNLFSMLGEESRENTMSRSSTLDASSNMARWSMASSPQRLSSIFFNAISHPHVV